MRPVTFRGNELMINLARGFFAVVLARRGRYDEAAALATEVREIWLRATDPFFAAFGRNVVARAFAECGRLEVAEAEGRAAVDALGTFPPHQVGALARLARVLVARGQAREALEIARRAHAMYARGLGSFEMEASLDLAMAEALHANGDLLAARTWVIEARRRLHARAEQLPPEMRRPYLEQAPDHARIERLASEWSSDASSS
jgi:hypothetical protein